MTGHNIFYELQGTKAVPHNVEDLPTKSLLKNIKTSFVGPYFVSTVFLGINHSHDPDGPPVLFETMAFDMEDSRATGRIGKDFSSERSSTYHEALETHDRIIDECYERWDPSPWQQVVYWIMGLVGMNRA